MRVVRPITFLVESIAIGAGALLLSGAAYADSVPPTSDSSTVTVVTQTDSQTTEGQSISDTTVSTLAADSGSEATLQTSVVTSLEPQTPPTDNSTVTAPLSTEQSEPSATPPVSEPVDNGGADVSSMSVRSNLASTRYSALSLPYSTTITTANEESSQSAPVSSQSLPKAPTPVMPLGTISAILSLFAEAVPGFFGGPVDPTSASSWGLLMVLTMVAGAVAKTARTTVVSYGTWLKLTGFVSVARSGLPASFSSFATPSLMGYVSAPAPYA